MSARVRSPVSRAETERLVRAVLRAQRVASAILSVALVGRARIRALNRRHLGRDRETDVIAFALTDPLAPSRTTRKGGRSPLAACRLATGPVIADVYVCVPVGVAQARRFGATPREEVRRLVVHGVLHALGHDHPAGRARTASPMWRLQERLLVRAAGARSGGRPAGRP